MADQPSSHEECQVCTINLALVVERCVMFEASRSKFLIRRVYWATSVMYLVRVKLVYSKGWIVFSRYNNFTHKICIKYLLICFNKEIRH